MNRTSYHLNTKRLTAWLMAAMLLLAAFAGTAEGAAATIKGCAYVDSNQNLICDEGEPLMSGLPVRLYAEADGQWQEVAAAETDEYGQYAFTVAEAGTYCVRSSTTAADYAVLAVGESAVPVDGSEDKTSAPMQVTGSETFYADVSLGQAASVEVTVYRDENSDGKHGQYDEGVKGVLVELMDGETVVASGETAKKGIVNLSGFLPGTYTLRFTVPEGFGFAVKGENFDKGDSIVEASGSRVATSDPFTFEAGAPKALGAGVLPVGLFSGKVFEDANNNGIMDETDPGVAGVSLRLEGKKSGNVYEMVSGEDGTYLFDLLPADTYIFTAQLPDGLMYARYSKDGGDLRSVFTGETLEREFAVSAKKLQTNKNVGVIQNGTISGVAFYDENYNGIPDENEAGYEGVTLEAIRISTSEVMAKTVTAEDGTFTLEGLRSSEYRLRAILPDDGSTFSCLPVEDGVEGNRFVQNRSSRESRVEPITVTSGSDVQVLLGVAKGATVNGVLFEDANYNGVKDAKERTFSGLKVMLVDEEGNVAYQSQSAAKGVYTISGIMPGTYTLKVQRNRSYGFTRLRSAEEGGSYIRELIDGYGVSDPMEIAMAEELTGVNAGMLPAGNVSGILFHDRNDNGVQDEDEFGLNTATVRLLSSDGEIDLVRPVDEAGHYLFDGVMPGDYTITFQLPDNTEIAQVAQGGNTLQNAGQETTTDSFAVAMGEEVTYPLVGAVTLGTLEGTAFHDKNADGQQSADEETFANVRLVLSNGSDAYEATTAGDGSFAITDLRPGDYQLEVTMPDGYIAGYDAGSLPLEPLNTQTVACPWSVLISRQPVAVSAVKPALIAGEIRLDENNNGQSESSERMMTGITLELVDELSGKVQTTVSSESGFVFDSVRPGTYTVRFALPQQAEPAQVVDSSFRFSGAAMEQSGIVVAENQQVTGLGTALVSRTSIGGALQLYDEAGQQPVADVTVTLMDDATGTVLATSVSDENGNYRFDGLWPGQYRIQAAFAPNAIFVRPDDANYPQGASIIQTDDGVSGVIDLRMAEHRLSENVLYIRTAKVGDLAWVDENANGLLDGSERRLPGVQVQLLQNGQPVYETTTDAHGYYQFASVYPGTYTLQASAYAELTITTPVPSLRIISSCLTSGDGQMAQSDAFTVESGSVTNDFDLGYVLLPGQQLPQLPEEPTRDWSDWNAQYASMQTW